MEFVGAGFDVDVDDRAARQSLLGVEAIGHDVHRFHCFR